MEKQITKRTEDFSQWYQDVIEAADLAEHGPVKGTMIIKQYGYALWERIQQVLDKKIKTTGVDNVYFPMFIPESFLKKEAEHVEGFSPELAVVTHAGGKELTKPLIVRPTSETIMYDAFARWLTVERKLPILINQWANVVRWELRPRLFLRTTEFLWQEGHTAHASAEEADARARQMLEMYREFAEKYMALPVITGVKSDAERFAGAQFTYSCEAIMQDGKSLQFATSHNLGQNFAKVFNITFFNEENKSEYAWQTSWGMSTRSIGGLIMAHGDDKGLVIPPKMAPTQVVIIPIYKDKEANQEIIRAAENIKEQLKTVKITKVLIDDSAKRPGDKYFYWEKRGVPLRLEIGPKDLANNACVIVRRDTGEKMVVKLEDIGTKIKTLLATIQNDLLTTAQKNLHDKIKRVDSWSEFQVAIENGFAVMAHWDGTAETEAKIKEETKATMRCYPFDEPAEAGQCVYSGKPSAKRALFAKSY